MLLLCEPDSLPESINEKNETFIDQIVCISKMKTLLISRQNIFRQFFLQVFENLLYESAQFRLWRRQLYR